MSRAICTKFMFYETGGFEQQRSRSYKARNVDDNTIDKVLRVTNDGLNMNASALSSVVSEIIGLDANKSTELFIPNGWDETRMSFIIELLLDEGRSSEKRQILTGYTDKMDLSHNDSLDPETELYINNSFILASHVTTGRQGRSRRTRVIANDFIIRPSDSPDSRRRNRTDPEILLRSEDVFYNRDSKRLSRRYNNEDVVDSRFQLSGDLKFARRADSHASDYLTSILRLGVSAEHRRRADDYSNDPGNVDPDTAADFQRMSTDEMASGYTSAGRVDDQGIFQDFLLETDINNSGIISLEDFERLVDFDSEPVVIKAGTARRDGRRYNRARAGDHAEWGIGSRNEDVLPDILKMSIPSLLLRFNISEAEVIITNQTLTGEIDVVVTNEIGTVEGLDTEPFIQPLEDAIKLDLAHILTRNNQDELTVTVDFSIITGMVIGINRHDGDGEISYNAAIWADGLQTCMRSSDRKILDEIVNDTDDIIEDILEAQQDFD